MLPLSYPIYQAVLRVTADNYNVVAVRVDKDRIPQTMAQIEEVWARVLPDQEFRPQFLSDIQSRSYSQEQSLGRLFTVFTLLAGSG